MSDSNRSSTGCACQNLTIRVASGEIWEHDKKFTVYKVYITAGSNTWYVLRRFQLFHDLYEQLKTDFPQVQLKLPKKKLFGNLNPTFIEQRRAGLDAFAQQIFANYDLLHHPRVRDFFSLEKCDGRRRSSPANSDGSSGVSSAGEHSSDTQGSKESDSSLSNESISLGPSERPHIKPSDFEFFNVIGKGSFGKVFLARHKTEHRLYAIKVLQKDYIKRRNEIKHIMAERNVLVENVRHPFLVGLHYSFQTKDKLYFVLDYVNGGELYFHLQKDKTFSEERSRFYAAEIASALGYLHSKNIIYRDLKPENLLLDSEGHVVLTDFGLCKEGIHGKDTTATFCGTAEYLAPEVIMKQAYDKTVDWWCLGSVLYEMLFGLPPFYNRDHKLMYENILYKPLRLRNTVSQAAKDILVGLLQKDRTKRLGSLHDFDEIQYHAFFSSVDWDAMEAKKIKPPFNPNVVNQFDLRNIDREFLCQSIPNSVVNPLSTTNHRDNDFLGFTYVPSTNATSDNVFNSTDESS